MPNNIGTIDRVLRILVAVSFTILFFLNIISGSIAIILLIVAAALIITSIIGFCPLYSPLKINTSKKK
jgi:hypothetical protein